jgi:acyl dehydratase
VPSSDLGLFVRDTSENAAANLGWSDIKLPKPVFVGDTLWAGSEVLSTRQSNSRPSCGIVKARTRGINHRADVVIEFVEASSSSSATQWSPRRPFHNERELVYKQ